MYENLNKMFTKVDFFPSGEVFIEPFSGFLVIIYLVLFQLDSVGFKLLRGFIYSSQLYHMHQV